MGRYFYFHEKPEVMAQVTGSRKIYIRRRREAMKVNAFIKNAATMETLKSSKIYKAVTAADNGDLSLLKDMYQECCCGHECLEKGFYLLSGWKFDISEFCKSYLVKFKYDTCWREYKAPNKTCLYRIIGKRYISEICEKP